jgi:hypothetical protein
VLPTPKKTVYAHATSPGSRLGGARIFKHLKDTVTHDERFHHADVSALPALPTENSESEAARLEGA